MTFKQHWEKSHEQHEISADQIKTMVSLGCPGKEIISTEIIAGGCANFNIKVQCENCPLYLLRIYLRDHEAPYREQKIALLIKDQVPVPMVHFIGNYEGYAFSIVEFLSGITLRELLLSDQSYNMSSLMEEVGIILSRISKLIFSQAGFFDKDLLLDLLTRTNSDSSPNQSTDINQLIDHILEESCLAHLPSATKIIYPRNIDR